MERGQARAGLCPRCRWFQEVPKATIPGSRRTQRPGRLWLPDERASVPEGNERTRAAFPLQGGRRSHLPARLSAGQGGWEGNIQEGWESGESLAIAEALRLTTPHPHSLSPLRGEGGPKPSRCEAVAVRCRRLQRQRVAVKLCAMWTFPDAKLPSENQRRALSRLAYVAFLDMRMLGREGKGQQVVDLAEAFHNLPLMLWTEDFSMNCQHDFLQRYRRNTASPSVL